MSSVQVPKPKMTQGQFSAIISTYLAQGDYANAAKLMWPWFEQNEWTDKIWKAIEKHKYLCIIGHGSASKTCTASVWFMCDWLTWSKETALVITSDTIPSMDRRIWADFKMLWDKNKLNLSKTGQILDSKRMIRTSINDGKNAIHAIAAESDDAQTKIQGLHTKRVRVVIDEADNPYSSSIWSAIPNLGTSGDLKCVALANPSDRNSEFGAHCEPVNGWDSINPELDFEWTSKLGWHVLRLDGLQSPNLLAGVDRYPFLLTNQGVQDIREKKGIQSPEWWTYVRAWYPPEGLVKTIFSEDVIARASKPILWYSGVTPVASCDPAFEGGDACEVTFGRMGRLADNPQRTGLEVSHQVTIKRKDVEKTLAFDYADQIVQLLEEAGVEPENFGIDTTGTQGPFADIIEEKMKQKYGAGRKICRVTFGGGATDLRILAEDTRTCRERFRNFVTELWFASREWFRLGLVYVKDMNRDLRIQLSGRRYELKGKDAKSGLEMVQAEPKKEMKARGLMSPDKGDSLAILIHVVRLKANDLIPGSFRDTVRATVRTNLRRVESEFTQNYGIDDMGRMESDE